MAKRKRRKSQREEPVYHLIALEDWNWSYSFGVDRRKDFDDPYLEFRHVHIYGKPLHPRDIKANRVVLILLPREQLNEASRQQDEPSAIGLLNLRDDTLEALLSIPADALGPILQVLAAGKARYATMDATRLRYRQGRVRQFSLDEFYDEEDWPADNA